MESKCFMCSVYLCQTVKCCADISDGSTISFDVKLRIHVLLWRLREPDEEVGRGKHGKVVEKDVNDLHI